MPAPPPRAQPVAYFRLHGLGGYRYSFTEADLRWLAGVVLGSKQRPNPVLSSVKGGERTIEMTRAAGPVRGYKEAWVLFNNMSMWDDARRFKRLLARSA